MEEGAGDVVMGTIDVQAGDDLGSTGGKIDIRDKDSYD